MPNDPIERSPTNDAPASPLLRVQPLISSRRLRSVNFLGGAFVVACFARGFFCRLFDFRLLRKVQRLAYGPFGSFVLPPSAVSFWHSRSMTQSEIDIQTTSTNESYSWCFLGLSINPPARRVALSSGLTDPAGPGSILDFHRF